MKTLFDGCKSITFAEPTVTIRSALRDDSLAQIDALAAELMK